MHDNEWNLLLNSLLAMTLCYKTPCQHSSYHLWFLSSCSSNLFQLPFISTIPPKLFSSRSPMSSMLPDSSFRSQSSEINCLCLAQSFLPHFPLIPQMQKANMEISSCETQHFNSLLLVSTYSILSHSLMIFLLNLSSIPTSPSWI